MLAPSLVRLFLLPLPGLSFFYAAVSLKVLRLAVLLPSLIPWLCYKAGIVNVLMVHKRGALGS